MWPFNKQKTVTPTEPRKAVGFFTSDTQGIAASNVNRIAAIQRSITKPQPNGAEAMDSAGSNSVIKDLANGVGVPDAQLLWYGSQGFIGYNLCAIMAQHWLIDKACSMPARDAVRQGYDVTINNGEGADPEIIDAIRQGDKAYGVNKNMRELITMARVFGVRICIFKVQSTDPEYYEKPFNLDGVQPGSYIGISQVDPIWCSPILTSESLRDPAGMRFYEPEFWQIGSTKYHRSHLYILVPKPVADILKPSYQYGGKSVPQLIYERVYASERTANEAPQLAMTKRTTVLKLDMATFMAKGAEAINNILDWCSFRDNYGVKLVDKDSEDIAQFDTTLSDLDATVMTQYQLVAAASNVPSTKLLGTTPKGFNSTGEYEESNYREELESIQANDLTPFLERHHQILMRSDIAPKFNVEPLETSVSWAPLDSPTATEWAALNKTKAETAQILAGVGAIDGIDIRKQITSDKDSDYFGLEEVSEESGLEPAIGSEENGQATAINE